MLRVQCDNKITRLIGFSASTEADSIISEATSIETFVELDIATGTPSYVLMVASVIWGMRVCEGGERKLKNREDGSDEGEGSHASTVVEVKKESELRE